MARGFASVLDECLAAIHRGESLEDCLARYPKHAEDLRTHLLLAKRLSLTPRHEPRAAAESGAWQKFRSRAEDMREGRKPALSLDWLRPLAIAAALVLAILTVGGGTVYASQDVLPDSPLYRVKLATEDVRVWFTFDDSRKADMLLDQSNERTEEIMEMLRSGKGISGNVLTALRQRNARAVRILEDHPDEVSMLARARQQSADQEKLLLVLWGDISESARDDYAEVVATLHNAQLRTAGRPGAVTPDDLAAGVINIAGAAEPGEEGVWSLGGVEVRLSNITLGETAFEAGQPIRVVAARGADGELLALNVTTTGQQQQEQKYVVSGAVEQVSDNEVVIGGQSIAITERTLLKLQLLRGKQVEIRVEEDDDGQAVASSIEGPTGGAEDPAPAPLAYEGMIEDEISTEAVTNDWLVGGQRFIVTPNTEIDARAGDLTAGARARVEAVAEDGEVIARRVVVLPDDPGEETIRVEGVLEKTDGQTWTVSGVEMAAPAEVEAPEVGTLITLHARRDGDALVAEQLVATFASDRGSPVLLRGGIGQIDENGTWRVGFAEVQVGESAVILGDPQQGSRVLVWASRDDQGSLQAVYVNVLDRSPLAATPTPTPAPTSQE